MEMNIKIIEFTSGIFSKPSQLKNIQIISLTTGTDILINIFKAITESETYKFTPTANIIKFGLYKNKILLGKGEIDTTIHDIQKIKIIKEGSLKYENSKITKESKDTSTEESDILDFDLTIHCFPAKKKICITPIINKKCKDNSNLIRFSLMQKNLNKNPQGIMLNEKLQERFELYRNSANNPLKTEVNNSNTLNNSAKKNNLLSSTALNFENDNINIKTNILENNDELLINNNELQGSDKPLFKFQSQKKVKLSKFLMDNSMDASSTDNNLKNNFVNSLNSNNNIERNGNFLNKSTVLNNNTNNHKLLASKEMEEQIMNQSFENEIINDNLILSKDEKIGIQDFFSGEIYFTNFFNLVDDFNMLYNKSNISNIPNIDIQLEFQLFIEKSLEIFSEYYKNWDLVNKQNKELLRYVKFYSSGEIQYNKLQNKLKTYVQKNKIKKRLNENDKISIPNNVLKITSLDSEIDFFNILENFTDISANFAKFFNTSKLKTNYNENVNKIKLRTIYDKIMSKNRTEKKNIKNNCIHAMSSKYTTEKLSESENLNKRFCNLRKGPYSKNTSGSANKEKKNSMKSKKYLDYSLNFNNISYNCGYGTNLEKDESKDIIKRNHKGSDINYYGNNKLYTTNNIVKKIMINNHLKKTLKNVKQ